MAAADVITSAGKVIVQKAAAAMRKAVGMARSAAGEIGMTHPTEIRVTAGPAEVRVDEAVVSARPPCRPRPCRGSRLRRSCD